jgi:hypothetical protein
MISDAAHVALSEAPSPSSPQRQSIRRQRSNTPTQPQPLLSPQSQSASHPFIPSVFSSSHLVPSIVQSPDSQALQIWLPSDESPTLLRIALLSISARRAMSSAACQSCLVSSSQSSSDNPLTMPAVANRSEIATRIFRTAHELSM